MNSVVHPVEYTEQLGITVYLDGPTDGPDWRGSVIARIMPVRNAEAIIIANPRNWDNISDKSALTLWRVHHFQVAARRGVIILWIPANTVYDFQAWIASHDDCVENLVVGVSPICRYMDEVEAYFKLRRPNMPINHSIEEICTHAVLKILAI